MTPRMIRRPTQRRPSGAVAANRRRSRPRPRKKRFRTATSATAAASQNRNAKKRHERRRRAWRRKRSATKRSPRARPRPPTAHPPRLRNAAAAKCPRSAPMSMGSPTITPIHHLPMPTVLADHARVRPNHDPLRRTPHRSATTNRKITTH